MRPLRCVIWPTAGVSRIADDDQVVVRVERQLVGIKRPLRHRRRPIKLLGKHPRRKHRYRTGGQAAFEQISARQQHLEVLHWMGSPVSSNRVTASTFELK